MKINLNLDFDSFYILAKHYYEFYKNLYVPVTFNTFDGVNYDKDGYSLGIFLIEQKTAHLKKENKKKLLEIGFSFHHKILTFEEYYRLLKNYYDHYKNLDVKEGFKTLDGVNYDENGYSLYDEIVILRAFYHQKMLTDEKIGMLIDIDFPFSYPNEELKK